MTELDQLVAIAELDGWKKDSLSWFKGDQEAPDDYSLPDYLHSRDAIVPVVENQPEEIRVRIAQLMYADLGNTLRFSLSFRNAAKLMVMPPEQLCEALLRATERWK